MGDTVEFHAWGWLPGMSNSKSRSLYTFLSSIFMTCANIVVFMFSNKVVVGSGSEGAPKCMGEGVTYGVFLGCYSQFFTCMPPIDILRQNMHTLGYVVVMLHNEMMSFGTPMMSSHDVVMTS